MPDDGTCDDKPPPDVVIGNRPRSRSQSVESRGIRRFYSASANPAMVARGITTPEKGEPEEGSAQKNKRKKSKKHEKAPLERVKEEKDPDGPPGPDGGAAASAVA